MDKVSMTKSNNRRRFFRIYDEVNLSYKKIDQSQLTEPHSLFDDSVSKTSQFTELETVSQNIALRRQEKNRPDRLQLKENDTRNVNLSASGMAFTCEDQLNEGDYLEISLRLASGITNIVTYAKVVYRKNSNPYENDYPYLIGAHFVDIKDEDKDLLTKLVNKKRLKELWINGFLLAIVLTTIAAPTMVFGSLLDFLHLLLELFIELSHLAFEFIESGLDHVIEYFFATGLHITQIIVFYIILSVISYACYRAYRVVPPFCLRCKNKNIAYWSRKKASLLYYWREQTLFNKIKLAVIGVAVIVGCVFLNM